MQQEQELVELFNLAGQTLVVTGGTRGIGRAIAGRALQYGARVVITGRRAEAVEAVAAELDPAGAMVVGLALDISSLGQVADFPSRVQDRVGDVDAVVLNAAVNPFFGPSASLPREAYQRVIDCNITSNVDLTNAFAPAMAARGNGSITVISSIGGLRGSTHLGAYALSKAADMQLVRNLAVEWGPQNVRANCIAPGLIRTDFARALWEDEDILRRRVHHTPLQRIGTPDEVAGLAIMLMSPSGRYITGQTLVVDGGVMAGSPWQTEGGNQ